MVSKANNRAGFLLAGTPSYMDIPKNVILYVDDFTTLLLNKPQWPIALQKMKSWGTTYIAGYNASTWCKPANFTAIAEFITLAKTYGIVKMGGVWGSTATADKFKVYNDQATYETQLSMAVQEDEEWNTGDWEGSQARRLYVYNLLRGITPPAIKFKMNCWKYFGWFLDKVGVIWNPAQEAEGMLITTNGMFMHQYRTAPSLTNLLDRWRQLDNSAQALVAQGKLPADFQYQFYVLISGESKAFKNKPEDVAKYGMYCPNEFSGQYLKTKSMTDWYAEVIVKLKAYLADPGTVTFKHVKLVGIAGFDYYWFNQTR